MRHNSSYEKEIPGKLLNFSPFSFGWVWLGDLRLSVISPFLVTFGSGSRPPPGRPQKSYQVNARNRILYSFQYTNEKKRSLP